jgi:hypothetical protein
MWLRRTASAALMALPLLAACGSTEQPAPKPQTSASPPAALVAESRPIGRGPSFQPAVRGPVAGACERSLGRRNGVHVEVFAANRVLLLPAGIGTKPPRTTDAGRITSAGCYGDLVTLDPTGLVLLRPTARPTVGDLFRSWGEPLSSRRLGSFTTSPGGRIAVFVNGRRWPGQATSVPLRPHDEIVLEVGPYVPPHHAYTFPPGT